MDHLDTAALERPFARLGLRVRFERGVPSPFTRRSGFSLDVARDRRGEHFLLRLPERAPEICALDVRPDLRQLLMLVRQEGRKDKFLCGFDERHLFTAALPGASVRDVPSAVEALKPAAVRDIQLRRGLSGRERLRRHNTAFIRQGEWFFVPAAGLVALPERIRRGEPLSRGPGSSPHLCAEAVRLGGEVVWVSRHRGPLTRERHEALLRQNPEARGWDWQQRVRNPELYVRGTVRHRDHATIQLPDWHRVLMNTEPEAPAARHVSFLD